MSHLGAYDGATQTNGTNGHFDHSKTDFDTVVIGSGFGGLRMLYELRKQGLRGRVFEAGSGVGGVWTAPYPR